MAPVHQVSLESDRRFGLWSVDLQTFGQKTRYIASCIATVGSLATKLKRAHSEIIWHLFTKFHRIRPFGLENPDNKPVGDVGFAFAYSARKLEVVSQSRNQNLL